MLSTAPALRALFSCLIAWTLLSGSAAMAAAPDPELPEDWPDWLKEAMPKEAKRQKATTVTLGDDAVTLTLRGKVKDGPTVADFGWYFAADIGATAPMNCWVFNARNYLASTLQSIQDSLIAALPEENEGAPIKLKQVFYYDAGNWDVVPHMTSEWLYVVDSQPSPKIGLLKGRVAARKGVTFTCSHNELGYRKSFARVFEAMITDAVINLPREEPYFEEVQQFSANGRPVGVVTATYWKDKDGDTYTETHSSIMMQVDAGTLTTSDSLLSEYSFPDGSLINAVFNAAQNGEESVDLVLNPTDANLWEVSGQFQGKTLKFSLGEINESNAPLSTMGQVFAIRDALKSEDDGTARMQAWLPDADPSSFISGQFAVQERGKKRNTGLLSMGPVEMQAAFDPDGSLLDAGFEMGPLEMKMERTYQAGELEFTPGE
ncbi:MAG: hypothetical protein AAFN78_03900 [Pseudomonadota bacterium]